MQAATTNTKMTLTVGRLREMIKDCPDGMNVIIRDDGGMAHGAHAVFMPARNLDGYTRWEMIDVRDGPPWGTLDKSKREFMTLAIC